jgi:putative ABC transport system substrate-binding protein
MKLTRSTLTVGLVLSLVAAPLAVEAQETAKVYRVGYLESGSRARLSGRTAFGQGMRDLGYVEGRNLIVESRFAEGKLERLPSLAQELVRLKPDVLLAVTTPGSLAAKAATATIPIVFVAVADPVGVGLVTNLARPGRNITGVTHIVAELTGKRLELLTEIVPTASRIAVIVNPDDPNAPGQIRNAEAAARTLKVQLQPVLNVRGASDLEGAFEAAVRSHAGAVLRMVDPTGAMLRVEMVTLAMRHRLPVMYAFREDVEAGGLAAYGANSLAQFRQTATFVHKILHGARPGDLPIEQPTKFEFVINLKTAKTLGLTIPPSLLLRADQIIE